MKSPKYPAARIAASRVQPHFSRHLAGGEPGLAPHPDPDAVEAIVDAGFWASLRREEGFLPRISLAFLPSELAVLPLRFEHPLPLAPEALTRLAPAVERPGIHLGVWRNGDELSVWGATRAIPPYCFVLEVVAPGLLVIKHRRGEDSGKFVNVAVIEGDQVKVVDPRAPATDCPNVVASLLGFEASAPDSSIVLTQLAVSMRAHGRGGMLLVVPSRTEAWRESIVQPLHYSLAPRFPELAELMRQDGAERRQRRWQDAVRRSVDAIAGLTAVDGAAIITDEFDVLGFGAKVGRRYGWAQVDQVLITEPIEGASAIVVQPAQIGGTRHLSAAQFAHDQHDATALVASQDGRFTVFSWSDCDQMVHAHRVETLLL